jgi:hypothetical protein
LRRGSACLASLVALSAIALGACQSSQEKSAELEKSGHNAISKEKGLQITAVNKQVKVLDTTTLTDKNGSAVVVTLKNESSQGLINTPIAIDVQDAKGKSVFKNNDPGLEASLIGVPLMQAGQTVDWVNDQVLAAGTPKSVKVQVGSTKDTLSSSVPELEVSKPKLKTDPYSGTEAAGTVTNKSGIDQTRLILFAVARKDGKVVAAGRGGIKRLPADGKPTEYHIYFIGDPRGADVTVTAPPTVFN